MLVIDLTIRDWQRDGRARSLATAELVQGRGGPGAPLREKDCWLRRSHIVLTCSRFDYDRDDEHEQEHWTTVSTND